MKQKLQVFDYRGYVLVRCPTGLTLVFAPSDSRQSKRKLLFEAKNLAEASQWIDQQTGSLIARTTVNP